MFLDHSVVWRVLSCVGSCSVVVWFAGVVEAVVHCLFLASEGSVRGWADIFGLGSRVKQNASHLKNRKRILVLEVCGICRRLLRIDKDLRARKKSVMIFNL